MSGSPSPTTLPLAEHDPARGEAISVFPDLTGRIAWLLLCEEGRE